MEQTAATTSNSQQGDFTDVPPLQDNRPLRHLAELLPL